MAEMIVLRFSAPKAVELYRRVNDLIGLDPSTGAGDWPAGLLDHQAAGDDEAIVVVETWETRAAQEEFMRDRLVPAFAEADVPAPESVTWLPHLSHWQRT